jgi:RyR domain
MKTILVTGDVVVDHHIYEGQRYTASASDQRGVKVKRQHGGAKGLTDLIKSVIAQTESNWKKEKKKREQSLQNVEENLRKIRSNSKGAQEIGTAEEEVKEATKKLEPPLATGWSAQFGLTVPLRSAEPCGHHALAIWKPFPEEPSDPKSTKKVWRAEPLLGYGHDDSTPANRGGYCPGHTPEVKGPEPASPQLLVLDDGGFVFRHRAQEECWFLSDSTNSINSIPEWIILKMSGPVCRGDLWARLKEGRYKDRLIVVVSAQDLRQECVRLSTGLSWERTVEELHEALYTSPLLKEIATLPRHLLVMFSGDGALWLDNTGDQPRATLIYDAGGAEGAWAPQFKGKAFGYLSCMVAALVYGTMQDSTRPRLDSAVRAGLSAMRDLHKMGHGPVSDKGPDGFPVDRLAEIILRGGSDFSSTPVPWTKAERGLYAEDPDSPGTQRPWRIVEMSQSPFGSDRLPSLLGLATQVVLQGESAIKRLPHARFGRLLTADRFEIEFLRSIQRLMTNYHYDREAKKPLCIGVFGPPGAGKSFGVRQIADSIFGEKAWLVFNLSQFKDVGDLIGAFHQVRDMVLGGLTPVVFWDEFDSREYYWLQYLLAPMQDGRFQEGQVNHAIGKCAFIFAGATSFAFGEFGPPKPGRSKNEQAADITPEAESLKEARNALDDFRLKKGPDFHSRLDGYFDVLGPNRRTRRADSGDPFDQRVTDEKDVCAPLRRALLIRALLNVPTNSRVDFDADLLNALLRAPNYLHGARSLEKLVQSLRPSQGKLSIRRSALPSPAQLAMHIDDVTKFNAILNQNISFLQVQIIETLAPAIHETWRRLSEKEGWKMQPHLDKPYKELEEVDKEENRAAARRIPEVLALAGLKLEEKRDAAQQDDADIRRHLEHHMERLAEAEHNGWMEHRIKNGWHYNEKRSDFLKQHPALLPYARLSEIDQKKDKNSVKKFPDMVSLAGYQIMWA